ncbi:hypothetical protein O181_104811 [Austropuccinia psidii MF-1]|uniref:Uncharacterized protein n=1 Tax=Austropuccinia psidii MF-1 TaxID=1389203 RepID=A0A9Q3JMY9_9BASI|nr:hypothetical protein [Austropuccinia psidii MF-1]
MESWPLLEENVGSLDIEISWIVEKEVWDNCNNPKELNAYPEWFLQIKPEPYPDIATIVLPYIEFKDIFEKEKSPSETVIPHSWKGLLVFGFTKYGFLQLLTWDGVEGNLGNQYWNTIFEMDEHLRK